METRANYAAVGGFVLVLMAGLIAFIMWFVGAEFNQARDRYRIRFEGPVRGLQLGSKVSLLGVSVGEVESIRLDPVHFGKIDVIVSVQEGTPIVEGATAELRLQGLTGTSAVLITGGSEGADPLKVEEGEELPVIPAKKSELAKLVATAPEIADRVSNLLERIEGFVTEENAEKFGSIVGNIDKITADIGTITGDVSGDSRSITQLIQRLNALALRLDNVAAQLEKDVSKISGRLDTSLGKFDSAADKFGTAMDSFTTTSDNTNAMIQENRSAIKRFTRQGLYEMTNLITRLQKLSDDISRIVRTIAKEGARALLNPGGGKVKE